MPDLYVVGVAFAGIAVLIAILTLTHHGERAFSPALVYLAMGVVGAGGVAVLDAPWLTLAGDAGVVERISEIAVVMALFATGLRIDHDLVLSHWRSTVLLLGVVMDYGITQLLSQFVIPNCSEDCYFTYFNAIFVLVVIASLAGGIRAGVRAYQRPAQKQDLT